jgi:long-subunit acyl-CoA synthetase (AMP-forming)
MSGSFLCSISFVTTFTEYVLFFRTIDNGMLTDAMKLKRAEINKKYKPALQALYAQQA